MLITNVINCVVTEVVYCVIFVGFSEDYRDGKSVFSTQD